MDLRGGSVVAARLALYPFDLLPSPTHRSLSPAGRVTMSGTSPEELASFREASATRERRGSSLHREVLLLPSEDDVSKLGDEESNSRKSSIGHSALQRAGGYRTPLCAASSLHSSFPRGDESALPSSSTPMLRHPVRDVNASAEAASSGTVFCSRTSSNAGGNGDGSASGREQCTSSDLMRQELPGNLYRTPRRAPLPFPFLYRYTVPLRGQSDEEDCNNEGPEGKEDDEEEGEHGVRMGKDSRKYFVSEATALLMMRARVLGTRFGTPAATPKGGSTPLRARTCLGSLAETPKSLQLASRTSGGLESNSDSLASTRFGSPQRNPCIHPALPHEPLLRVSFNLAEAAPCRRRPEMSGHVKDNCDISSRGDWTEDNDEHAIILQIKRMLVLDTRHGFPCWKSRQQQEQQQRHREQQNQRQQQHHCLSSKRRRRSSQSCERRRTQSVASHPAHSSPLSA